MATIALSLLYEEHKEHHQEGTDNAKSSATIPITENTLKLEAKVKTEKDVTI